jgi:hypothetical protein
MIAQAIDSRPTASIKKPAPVVAMRRWQLVLSEVTTFLRSLFLTTCGAGYDIGQQA